MWKREEKLRGLVLSFKLSRVYDPRAMTALGLGGWSYSLLVKTCSVKTADKQKTVKQAVNTKDSNSLIYLSCPNGFPWIH